MSSWASLDESLERSFLLYMSSKNKNLHKAKKEKNDEFYTLLSDIEKEMVWYKDFFKDKVVYCNCDDARESNFFKYFSENFELLGLKKLITTGYIPGGHGVVLEYSGDKNGDFIVSDDEISTRDLAGDGDFRSPECIEFLKQADVVVTNPPFSLFREYIAQLMTYGKKFIIIGNQNSICCKEIFPHIKDDELWLGQNYVKEFKKPDSTIQKFGNVCWFTNIINKKRTTKLDLCKKYNPADYPKYDNYNAINVDKVSDIPEDYYGVVGVPISFLDKYCPDQFEIIGNADADILPDGWKGMDQSFVDLYYAQGNTGTIKEGNRLIHYIDNKGNAVVPFKRILIKRKS